MERSLNTENFNSSAAVKTEHFLDSLAGHFRTIQKKNMILKEAMREKMGSEKYNGTERKL